MERTTSPSAGASSPMEAMIAGVADVISISFPDFGISFFNNAVLLLEGGDHLVEH